MRAPIYLFILLTTLLFTACKKKEEQPDTSSVIIELNGSDSLTLNKGAKMTDPGASARNKDGMDFSPYLTTNWSTKFSTNKLGTCEVLYQVVYQGNILAEKKRTITVIFPVKFPLGEYAGTYTYKTDQGGMPTYSHTDSVICVISQGPGPDQYIFNCNNKMAFNSNITVTAYDCELKEFSGGPGTGSPYRYKVSYIDESRLNGNYQTKTYSYDLLMK